MRTITTLLIVTTLLLACFPTTTAAQPGTLIWTDSFGDPYYENTADDIRVSGNTVIACGTFLRAYNAATGALLWHNGAAGGGSMTIGNNRIFTNGSTHSASGGAAFTVNAYDLLTGRLLWTKPLNREGTRPDYATALARYGSRVFAAGTTETSAQGKIFTVRAFDTATGKVLWTRYLNGSTGTGIDEALCITATADRVFAGGITTAASGITAFTVAAYSTTTGTPLWNSITTAGAVPGEARTIGVSGNKVIAAGNGGSGFGVAAFSASTGKLAWADTKTPGVANALVISDKVYVAGNIGAFGMSEADMLIRAYNPTTGALVWNTQWGTTWPGNPNDPLKDYAYDITTSNSKVFVTGQSELDDEESITTAAFDAATGSPLWHQFPIHGWDCGYGIAASSALNMVFSCGIHYYQFTVNAYEQ